MPREFQRTDRVAELIQRELAKLIQLKMRDPRVQMVTVSGVDLSRDLSHAKIYVSSLGESDEIQEIVKVLNGAKGFLRSELSQQVKLRMTPELHFKQDTSITEGNRIASLIDKAIAEDDEHPKDEE